MLEQLNKSDKHFIRELVQLKARNISESVKDESFLSLPVEHRVSMQQMRIRNICMVQNMDSGQWDKFTAGDVDLITPLVYFQIAEGQRRIKQNGPTIQTLEHLHYMASLLNTLLCIQSNSQFQ